MEERFFNIVAGILRVGRENLNINLSKDDLPTWDSLAHIALVAELEEELNIDIPIEDVPNIKSLSDFKKYIRL